MTVQKFFLTYIAVKVPLGPQVCYNSMSLKLHECNLKMQEGIKGMTKSPINC